MPTKSVAPAKAVKAAKGPGRREQILACAAELFANEGYEGASLMDLANTANIAKATLFHYFTTKDQILFELYTQAMDMALQTIRGVEPDDDPAVELERMLREHALLIMTNQSLFRVFFAEENGLEAVNLASIQLQQTEYLNIVADRVSALQKQKRVSRKVHSRVAAQSLLGIGSWTYKWYQPALGLSASEIADFIAQLALRGLLERR